MSQVHEKLQQIPPAEKAEQQLEPGGGGMRPKKGGKQEFFRKHGKAMLFGTLIVLAIGLSAHLAIKKYSSASSVQVPTVVAPIPAQDPTGPIQALMNQGRHKEVIAELETKLKSAPNDVGVLVNLALAYKKASDLTSARKHLITAIDIDSGNPVAHNNLGRIYASEGNWEAALASYNKALQVQPDYREALFNAAVAHEALKHWDASVTHYEQFLKQPGTLEKEIDQALRERLRRLRAFRAFALNHEVHK